MAAAAVSGDNGKILFDSTREGKHEIYIANADGTDESVLTSSGFADSEATWSPDGERIAFTSRRGNNTDVYVMNADGSGQTRLTTDPANDYQPAWSPNGEKIAFVSGRGGMFRVYVMNAEGSNQAPLVKSVVAPGLDQNVMQRALMISKDPVGGVTQQPGPGGGVLDPGTPAPVEVQPTWSANGKTIAFASNMDGNYDIYTVRSNGLNAKHLTNSPGPERHPVFSPDGTTLVYVSGSGAQRSLVSMNIASKQTSPLVENADVIQPDFSPDGTLVIFSKRAPDLFYNLFTVATSGGPDKQITTAAAQDLNPSWQALGNVATPTDDGADDNGADDNGAGNNGGQNANTNGCTITGTPGDDVLIGTPGPDVICGLAGNDIIKGLGGDDTIRAGSGADVVLGGRGRDRIFGQSGNDTIRAGGGADLVLGGRGRDRIFGQSGNDELKGNGGRDMIKGQAGRDELTGNGGRDRLYGNKGRDTFFAKAGGRDIVNGGKGKDKASSDRFDVLRSIEIAL
jgi:TolB protein